MKTVLDLKTEIRQQVFADLEPENLLTAHDFAFQEAFAEIAKWVPSEQTKNIDVIPFSETKFKCGQTLHPAPPGMVKRLYTVLPTVVGNPPGFCDPVDYYETVYPKPEYFARKIMAYITTLVPPKEVFWLGTSEANAQTDSGCGRARTGVFAKHNGILYVAPWLQSNELLVIEWEGIKSKWRDTDQVTDTQEYKKAIKLFFQYAHERDFGSDQRAMLFHDPARHTGSFDEALAELMWQDRENTKQREMPHPDDLRQVLTQDVINQGIAPDPTIVQTISQADIIDLNVTTTFLSAIPPDPVANIEVALPDGLFVKQTKLLMVPGNKVPTTATFIVNGRFQNPYSNLKFDVNGTSGNLVWDGFAWQLVGGNALLQP